MFDKILIANRGEIACRIIRTARRMGIATVAVYFDADRNALHVREADECVHIGPAPATDSYLRFDAIIGAALKTGAQAIHPGYGFLSENPDFVEAVEAAGLVFIGPSSDAIRAMGLKDAAKALMEQAGVPVVPGYHGAAQDDLAQEAARIGYPVLIKAVAGGGGKGMRLVEDPADFEQALASAQAEARAAFGNAAVLVEKYITSPCHIEMQVFGDGTRAVHLFERDCSLQRRHQKVIEEAPAPGMTAEVRAAMGAAAVRAAEAIGYRGAGTVEFIVDGSGPLRTDGFWFMEMNTRLQVEHPVTEAITGVDLVEWQLLVAAGHPLPAAQSDLTVTGHAVEARLYAEDVPAGFLPATGRLTHLAFPPILRADSGVAAGDEISTWYDPMIAKVIAHGHDRAAALATLQQGLQETQVAGTVTNLGFLRRLIADPDFAAGRIDTGLIGRKITPLTAPATMTAAHWAQATLLALGWPDGSGSGPFALWSPLRWTAHFLTDGAEVACHVTAPDGGLLVETPLGPVAVHWQHGSGWRFDGALARPMHFDGKVITLFDLAQTLSVPDPLDRRSDQGPAGDTVSAPMPGLVRDVLVVEGQEVAMGDRLVVMEAMKMEHTLRAPRAGTVAKVAAIAGSQVASGAVLVTLEDPS